MVEEHRVTRNFVVVRLYPEYAAVTHPGMNLFPESLVGKQI
jgi:hypothetical protein